MNILKRGAKGAEVKLIQQKLSIMADGNFGILTEEAVKEFQRSNGLAVDGIVGAKTWEVLGTVNRPKRYIDEIIIHYTATPEGEDFTNAQIKACHLEKGFSDIGYHYSIGLDGEVRKGRSIDIAGAHCLGHNTRSIGIAYVGGCPPRSVKGWKEIGIDTRTTAQKQALIKLLKELKREYPAATIHGHNEFANKPCPGFNAANEYKNL